MLIKMHNAIIKELEKLFNCPRDVESVNVAYADIFATRLCVMTQKHENI